MAGVNLADELDYSDLHQYDFQLFADIFAVVAFAATTKVSQLAFGQFVDDFNTRQRRRTTVCVCPP